MNADHPRGNAVKLARIKAQERAMLIDRAFSALSTGFKCTALVGCMRYVYLSAGALAGRSTTIDAAISAVLNVTANKWAAYLAASLSGVGWFREKTLRKRTIKSQADYIRTLERKFDPMRSSSGLTTTGEKP